MKVTYCSSFAASYSRANPLRGCLSSLFFAKLYQAGRWCLSESAFRLFSALNDLSGLYQTLKKPRNTGSCGARAGSGTVHI